MCICFFVSSPPSGPLDRLGNAVWIQKDITPTHVINIYNQSSTIALIQDGRSDAPNLFRSPTFYLTPGHNRYRFFSYPRVHRITERGFTQNPWINSVCIENDSFLFSIFNPTVLSEKHWPKCKHVGQIMQSFHVYVYFSLHTIYKNRRTQGFRAPGEGIFRFLLKFRHLPAGFTYRNSNFRSVWASPNSWFKPEFS